MIGFGVIKNVVGSLFGDELPTFGGAARADHRHPVRARDLKSRCPNATGGAVNEDRLPGERMSAKEKRKIGGCIRDADGGSLFKRDMGWKGMNLGFFAERQVSVGAART